MTELPPQALRNLTRWIIWKYEHTSADRVTKVPYQSMHPDRRAKTNNLATWSSYDMAVEASRDAGVAGIGIVLGNIGDGNNLCGVDLDGCIEDGVLNTEAKSIVERFPTYWEVSPSKTGLKAIGYGRKPANAGAITTECTFDRIEVYDSGRWFAITGEAVPGCPPISDITDPLAESCREWGLVREATSKTPMSMVRPNTSGVIERASAYLALMDAAVEGCGGHSALFAAACAMEHGFALGREEAIQLLWAEYNPRCVPPWVWDDPKQRREFERKVDQSIHASHAHPRGHLRDDPAFSAPDPTPINKADLIANAERRRLGVLPAKSEPLTLPLGAGIAIPKNLLCPPGLLGRVVNWINSTANHAQPELALANAIPFVGTVLGKKVRTDDDARTNFYTLGLGESCCGKNHSRVQLSKLAHLSGLGDMMAGEDVTSDAAVLRIAKARPCFMQMDEIGHFFSAQRSRNASTHEQKIIPTLTKLFTSAHTAFKAKEYADGEKNIGTIYEPCVSLYGTATPAQVWNSISLDQVQDGFMGRLLIFTSNDFDPDWVKVADKTPPDGLIDRICEWANFTPEPPEGVGNLEAVVQTAAVVPSTPEAEAELDSFRARARERRRAILHAGGDLHPLWGRAAEQASKLALVASVDRPHGSMVIDGDAMRWACQLVEVLIDGLVTLTSNRVANSDHERDALKLLDAIRKGGDEGIAMQSLARACRSIKSRERKELLADLIESGQVIRETRTTSGRPAVYLRLP